MILRLFESDLLLAQPRLQNRQVSNPDRNAVNPFESGPAAT